MIRVGLVLAAGHSRRFGRDNKLLAPFRGRPLAAWSAEAMRRVVLDHRLAVTGSPQVAALFGGFGLLDGPVAGAGQSDSLKIGLAAAAALGADRLLIALADMPLIGSDTLGQVLEACSDGCASAVTDGDRRMPPACFPHASFAAIAALSGDRGAGALLAGLPQDALIEVAPERLADVDTLADLARLSAG